MAGVVKAELTGRRRYRTEGCYKDFDECLILQVEVSEFVTGREDKPNAWVCRWRDATPDDVNKEELV